MNYRKFNLYREQLRHLGFTEPAVTRIALDIASGVQPPPEELFPEELGGEWDA